MTQKEIVANYPAGVEWITPNEEVVRNTVISACMQLQNALFLLPDEAAQR